MGVNNGKSRKFLSGVAVLAASLAGTVAATEASAAVTPSVNSANPQSQPDFVISPAQAPRAMEYQHESHASHASHESHASHASHTSHYSSAG
jgi:predicted membrane-bound mannosyltransferase